jgi:prolyl-tRNA synthetase
MKDAYSFDVDEAGLDESYTKHDRVYRRIFSRCGLEFLAVDADSGAMGGSASQEFMVYTEAGEDLIASSASGYAANVEKATSKLPTVEDLAATGDGSPELVHTPGQRTIDEVGLFLGVAPQHQMKTMAYVVEHPDSDEKQVKTVGKTRAVVVFLRGDHQLNETKLKAIAGGELRPMQAEEIVPVFGAPAGYLGPTGLAAAPHPRKPGTLVVLDAALEGRTNLIAGANQEEYHLRNVTPMRDFKPTLVADVRSVNEGEPDPVAGEPLRIGKAVEIGHIFKLGYKYSKSMGASVLNRDGKETTPIMGSYGIGIERILTAAIEQSAGQFAGRSQGEAYALPPSIAPFEVVVTVTNVREAELQAAGENLAQQLSEAGIDVLLDDRDERAGVKFKDAELIGVPFRVAIGKKLADGKVEILNRLTNVTDDVPVDGAVQHLSSAIAGSRRALQP